ncbi:MULTISPECIES: hypothetical protein [unclassified Pseudonocardia]|uniref:hypothetical protein n=1 Tax=unclassified Pseudonocardia TaxID=2619320 RepID=UPI000B129B6B|nr:MULTISPECIES: hypothetical protein [unclassified Pseudonocardia]
MDSYRHPDVVFVPAIDIEHGPISLCTRDGDVSGPVRALRRATRAAGHTLDGGAGAT